MSNQENTDQDDTDRDGSPDQAFDEDKRAAIYAFVDDSIGSEFAAEQYSVNTIFRTLTNPGRRYVLTYLLQSEGFVTVSELVDYVTNRVDASMTDEGYRRKVTAELTRTHLPDLEENGFIKYNMERQLVMPTETTNAVEPYLRIALVQQELVTERLES